MLGTRSSLAISGFCISMLQEAVVENQARLHRYSRRSKLNQTAEDRQHGSAWCLSDDQSNSPSPCGQWSIQYTSAAMEEIVLLAVNAGNVCPTPKSRETCESSKYPTSNGEAQPGKITTTSTKTIVYSTGKSQSTVTTVSEKKVITDFASPDFASPTSSDIHALEIAEEASLVRTDDLTPAEIEYNTNIDCNCKECNQYLYEQSPHQIQISDSNRPFALISGQHIPLCNLTDLYGYEPTTLVENRIRSFDSSNKSDKAELTELQKTAIKEFMVWRKCKTVGGELFMEGTKERELVFERVSAAKLQYAFELFNEIFFLGSLRATKVVIREMVGTSGLTLFPKIRPDLEDETDAVPEDKDETATDDIGGKTIDVTSSDADNGSNCSSTAQDTEDSSSEDAEDDKVINPDDHEQVDEARNRSILPILTIRMYPKLCLQELTVLKNTHPKALKVFEATKKRVKAANKNRANGVAADKEPVRPVAPPEPVDMILGTLLHEMAHAFIDLYTCAGTTIPHPLVGMFQHCERNICKSLAEFNVGKSGHGRVWFRLANALEINAYALLKLKTKLIGYKDYKAIHDIPEFFSEDPTYRQSTAESRS
ncbi:hypothetical protein EJ08DRAFT_717160 [Tothia fuscella]|uniref:SprT-like domain-containing protein n=1 Tax=Tothia fuscella TaxID=1048955 RepID=A0A9P4NPX6_9PEZI|nr:hypothetical protein EJ08DRAFT_717160 [Tothia fuscella]